MFTIDDGYKDNLYNALPVFQKHNIPFTVFITLDFPKQKDVLWWYVLEDLLLKNDSVHLNNGKTYICLTNPFGSPNEVSNREYKITKKYFRDLSFVVSGSTVTKLSKNNGCPV